MMKNVKTACFDKSWSTGQKYTNITFNDQIESEKNYNFQTLVIKSWSNRWMREELMFIMLLY